MAEPTRKIGIIDCLCCGETMPARQNGRDTINVSCPWCGFSAYAKGGSEAHGKISAMIRKDPNAPATPAPAAQPATPAPAPAASVKKLAKAFSMADL